jgi:hypothetical protein
MKNPKNKSVAILKKMQGEKLKPGQKVYVFEYGEGKVLTSHGYDESGTEEIYKVRINSEISLTHSSNCFALKKDGRKQRSWKQNAIEIEVTYDPIKLIFHGNPTWVTYSDAEEDRELFEEGDELHKDWEGMGIDFFMIITKWLKRLNGDKIPLSEYYKNPFNRWLDNLK